MSTQPQDKKCQVCQEYDLFPEAYVVHLSGQCCRCAEAQPEIPCAGWGPCGKCKEDCASLNQSVVVRKADCCDLCYTHEFEVKDFACGKIPCHAKRLSLKLKKHEKDGKNGEKETWYSACVVLTFSAKSNGGEKQEKPPTPATWYRAKIADCCNIGQLRRHNANRQCAWPKAIWVNGTPTPDYVAPQPEWFRGNPDDLNDAPFWPSLDIDLMEDSPEAPVRYFNGELQLRIKDIGSDGFGVPWGHTRIYSNRLSNSFDFGNGYNWLVHEWPQLVRRKTDPKEVKQLHPTVDKEPTGCTLVLLRGTRNALWFDEFEEEGAERESEWKGRFGAKHLLKFIPDQRLFKLIAPNGHVWEFHAFTPTCFETSKKELYKNRDRRLDGKMIRHLGPAGEGEQELRATYKNGRLEKVSRSEEEFKYEYYESGDNCGRLQHVVWSRGGADLRRTKYTYYEKDERFGNLGDLKTAMTQLWSNGAWTNRANDTQYFRYRTKAMDGSDGIDTYCQGLLKAFVSGETYHRLKSEGKDPPTATDEVLRENADLWIEYHDKPGNDSSRQFQARRVKALWRFGRSTSHTYEYEEAAFEHEFDYAYWNSKAVEQRPDGTRREIYSTFIGQTKRADLVAGQKRWHHYWEYWKTHPGVLETWEPENFVPTQGLAPSRERNASPIISQAGSYHRYSYKTLEGGRVACLSDVEVIARKSLAAPAIERLKSFAYTLTPFSHKDSRELKMQAMEKEITYGVANSQARNSNTPIGQVTADDNVTEYEYKIVGRGAVVGRNTILPAVPHSQHGLSSKPSVVKEVFDNYGNRIELQDLRGTRTENQYDVAKGAPVREIVNPSDGSAALMTSFKTDDLGRVTQVLGPAQNAVVPGSDREQTVRSAQWFLYWDLSGQIWSATGYVSGGSEVLMNPIHIEKIDRAGRITDSIDAVRGSTIGRPTFQDSLPQSTWRRWTQRIYDDQQTEFKTRVYTQIPGNFSESVVRVQIQDNLQVYVTPGGIHYRTYFDPRGLITALEVEDGQGNRTKTAELTYDENRSFDDSPNVGRGNLTRIKRSDGKNERVTLLDYDSRGRRKTVREAVLHNTLEEGRVDYEYNTQNAVTEITRSRDGATLATRTIKIDVRGRVYQTLLTPSEPRQANQPLVENNWFDDANQLIRTEPIGSAVNDVTATSFDYDALGRITHRRHSNFPNAAGGAFPNSPYPMHFEEVHTQYNEVGYPILVTTHERYPEEAVQAMNAIAYRSSYQAVWYDPIGRKVADADYGTRQPAFGASSPRPTTIPTSLFAQVTRYGFDETGELERVVSPMGIASATEHDAAGRVVWRGTNLPANAISMLRSGVIAPSSITHLPDDARLIAFDYDQDGNIAKQYVTNAHTGQQITRFKYRDGNSTPASGRLPHEIIDAENRKLTYTYNRLGELGTATDANETTHNYEYDRLGRIVADSISTRIAGSRIDDRVWRVEYVYDKYGRLSGVLSFDRDGTPVNRVIRAYGSLNQLLVEAQLHSASDPDETDRKYIYHGTIGQGILFGQHRRDHIGYYYGLDGRRNSLDLLLLWTGGDLALSYDSNTTADRSLGRVSSIRVLRRFPTRVIEPARYGYWGKSNLYRTEYEHPQLSSAKSSAMFSDLALGSVQHPAKTFQALDYLDREIDLHWDDRAANRLVDLGHGYDQHDNILFRDNEHPDAAGDGRDQTYQYNKLDRLTRFDQGESAGRGGPIANGTRKLLLEGTRDASGNWRQLSGQNSIIDASMWQRRSHSRTNHIIRINGDGWAQPDYDAAGNMIKMPQPLDPTKSFTCTYDGWNRITQILAGGKPVASYEYDGLGRRTISRTYDANGAIQETRHFYYDNGAVLSEYLDANGTMTKDREYVWGADGALVARIRQLPAGQEERLYALPDATGNVVAAVDPAGTVKERFLYDAFGKPMFLAPNFSALADPETSTIDWEHLSGTLRYDQATGLYFDGAGYHHPRLGRSLPTGGASGDTACFLGEEISRNHRSRGVWQARGW